MSLRSVALLRERFYYWRLNKVGVGRISRMDAADDAAALLQAGRYAGAYYIAGYVIECALKACIARNTRQGEFPPKDAARYYPSALGKSAPLLLC